MRTRGTLTREEIVDVAIDLATAGGEAGMSMRRLATALGVRPAAIYWHVGDRDALLDAMAARVASAHIPTRSRGRTPETRIAAVARALRDDLRTRPRLLEVLASSGRVGPVFAPLRNVVLAELLAAGYRGSDAVRRLRTVVFNVIGFVMVERGLGSYQPSATGPVADLAGLEPPAGLERAMSEYDADALFDFSLRTLLAGVFARLVSSTVS